MGNLYCYYPNEDALVEEYLESLGYRTSRTLEGCDIVVFTGGVDIHPRVYGHKLLPQTTYNLTRDQIDIRNFFAAKRLGKFCLGICRGAQLLWALSGGELYQDVDNHRKEHMAYPVSLVKTSLDFTKATINMEGGFKVSSTHHQMCNPYTLSGTVHYLLVGAETTSVVRGQSLLNLSPTSLSSTSNRQRKKGQTLALNHEDVEAYYVPRTECFGVQFHPEYQSSNDAARHWFEETFDFLLHVPPTE